MSGALPDQDWENAVARLPKKHQAVIRKDREELVGHAWRAEANAAYWRRKAADAEKVLRDRGRYVASLETQLQPTLVHQLEEAT